MGISSALVKKVKALFKRGEIGGEPATQLRDAVAAQSGTNAGSIAALFSAGKLTLPQFQASLYLETRNTIIAQYALGRGGGMAALTDADLGTIGRMLGTQAGYLRDFVGEIGKGGLTAEQIAQRASLFPESAIEAHSRGVAAAMGVDLPEHPPAHPNCRCSITWSGEGDARTWSWQTAGDPCPICIDLASQYSGQAA